MTRNLTLAVDEKLLERFRLHAAERKTSVNALLRQHMEETVGLEERRRNAIARMLELGRNTNARIDMSEWDRDATYDRRRKG
ncbi:MAG: ribbon-helix-helix protein, CopG family [Sphingomonadaceae bacterium]